MRELSSHSEKTTRERPDFIPESFYEVVSWHAEIIKGHVEQMSGDDECNKSKQGLIEEYKEKLLYLSNMISENLMLKDFFIENQTNKDLLSDVLNEFLYLPEWRHDYKTSGKDDANLIRKMEKNLRQCSEALLESPDVRLNIQMFWERYLKKINPALTHNKTRDKDGDIEAAQISRSVHLDFSNFVIEMSDFLAEIAPQAKDKTSTVKKIRSEDAYIHYIVRILKETLVKHNAPKHRHVKYICDLVNGILDAGDISEDRIRKLLKT